MSRTPEAGGQGRGTCHQERGAASEPQTLPPTPAASVCEGRAEGTGQGPDGRAPLPCLPTPPPALSLGEAGGGASRASGRSWQLAERWPCRPPPAPHPQPEGSVPQGAHRAVRAHPLCVPPGRPAERAPRWPCTQKHVAVDRPRDPGGPHRLAEDPAVPSVSRAAGPEGGVSHHRADVQVRPPTPRSLRRG